jgi:hypothetical protein
VTVARQLELFHGAHVPLLAALAALARGDLPAAREALGSTEDPVGRADAQRLAAIEAGAAPSSVEQAHARFESALAAMTDAQSAISRPAWLRLYAHHVAAMLASDPCRRFRGWCGLHYALATGGRPDASSLVSSCPAPWAWLEAARAAWAGGDRERAERWLALACLRADEGITPDPPRIAPSPVAALNPPPDALPRLPVAVEDVWAEAEDLDLPGPPSMWVPALMIIDGILSESLLGWRADLGGSGFDPVIAPRDEPAARVFLRALLRAREVRSADRSAGRAGLGDAELAARQQMRQAAPVLLNRYLARLGSVRSR